MPLPNTRIIPRTWSRHHAPVIATSMNASVEVGSQTRSAVVGDDVVPTYTNVYVGPARVQALQSNTNAESAGQEMVGRAYLVQLQMDTETGEVLPGMRIKVTAAENDPYLVGQDLWVTDPQYGSERFTRDVVASDNQSDAPSVSS